MRLHFQAKFLFIALVIFLIEVIIALYVHDSIIRPFGGDVLVVILIYYFVKAFIEVKTIPLCCGVLLFSYAVEFGQYFNLIKLLNLANNRLACIVIGTSFSWIDILCYTIGISACILIDRKKI